MKADLLMFQDRNVEARKLLTGVVQKYPKDPRSWTSLTRAAQRDEESAKKIPELLDRAEKALGDLIALRLLRIREIVLHGGDQTVAELKKLETGMDNFPEPQRVALMYQLGMAYVQGARHRRRKALLAICRREDTPERPQLATVVRAGRRPFRPGDHGQRGQIAGRLAGFWNPDLPLQVLARRGTC